MGLSEKLRELGMAYRVERKVKRHALYHLCEVLEWAKGLRGPKSSNPYSVSEVDAALHFLGDLQGVDWLDAETSNAVNPEDSPQSDASVRCPTCSREKLG